MKSRKAQLEAMPSSKQSNFRMDFEGKTKARSNTKRLARRFRALSGFEARPSCAFERPVAAEHAHGERNVRKSMPSAAFASVVKEKGASSSSDFER